MRQVRTRWVLLGVAVVALLLAGVVSHYASSSPDGLNRVAQDKGFSDAQAKPATADHPFAGYSTQAVDDPRLSTGLAGVVGVVVVLALASGLVLVVRRRGPAAEAEHDESDHDTDHEPVG